MTSSVGSPGWMAPELWDETSVYGPPVDIYAFGIVMWECLELSSPWRNEDSGEIRELVVSGKRPPVSSNSLKAPMEFVNLMNRCLNQDPEKRPPIGIVNTTLINDVITLDSSSYVRFVENDITESETIQPIGNSNSRSEIDSLLANRRKSLIRKKSSGLDKKSATRQTFEIEISERHT